MPWSSEPNGKFAAAMLFRPTKSVEKPRDAPFESWAPKNRCSADQIPYPRRQVCAKCNEVD